MAFKTLRQRQYGFHFAEDIFKCILLYENCCMYFGSNFPEICSLGTNWQYVSIGSGNGLAPVRRQAIIWTNDGLVYWRIYSSLGLNELMTPYTIIYSVLFTCLAYNLVLCLQWSSILCILFFVECILAWHTLHSHIPAHREHILILFSFHPNSNEPIATKFFTWPNSYHMHSILPSISILD